MSKRDRAMGWVTTKHLPRFCRDGHPEQSAMMKQVIGLFKGKPELQNDLKVIMGFLSFKNTNLCMVQSSFFGCATLQKGSVEVARRGSGQIHEIREVAPREARSGSFYKRSLCTVSTRYQPDSRNGLSRFKHQFSRDFEDIMGWFFEGWGIDVMVIWCWWMGCEWDFTSSSVNRLYGMWTDFIVKNHHQQEAFNGDLMGDKTKHSYLGVSEKQGMQWAYHK